MEVIKVLIAEDEPPVARFIKRISESTNLIRVVAMCESGERALEEIALYKPDILITDIRMSGMSGLELIRKALLLHDSMRSIIISGYKMFEYAQEAMSLGVVTYITKPIDPAELKSVLNKLVSSLTLTHSRDRGRQLSHALKTGNIDSICRIVGHPYYRISMFYCCGDIGDYSDGLPGLPAGAIQTVYRNMIVVMIGLDHPTQQCGNANQCYLQLCARPECRCTYLQGLQARRTENLAKDISADYSHLRRLAVPGVNAAYSYESSSEAAQKQDCADRALLEKLRAAICMKDYDRVNSGIVALFEKWKQKNASIYYIKTKLRQIAETLFASGLLDEGVVPASEYFDDSIRFSLGFDEICDEVRNYILGCFVENKETVLSPRKDAHTIYEQIIRTIHDERVRNYSLQEISDLYDVSQPYIRKIFKAYAGKSYNEYVLDRNIQRAKSLMEENPQILVKDVAEYLGFEQMYFSTVFRKKVGMTPSQFRDKLLSDCRNSEGV